MPGGKTKFQLSWLESLDSQDCAIGFWCSKGKTDFDAYCSLCKTNFSISNNGKHQILSHSLKKKHVSAYKSVKDNRLITNMQTNLPVDTNSSNSGVTLGLALNRDMQVAKAETIWALKVVSSNYSYNSCNDLNDIFNLMFPDNSIAQGFKLGSRKLSYVISYGLAPYFASCLASDIQQSVNDTFSLSFDETTTLQVKKQFDVFVRFWSSKKNMVECAYLTSAFLGHATAEIVVSELLKIMEENKLPLNKLSMLSMDGPNVNRLIMKKINYELVNIGEPKLLDIGTCSLHKVHNGLSKGIEMLDINVDEFATDLFAFFKSSSARREDFSGIQALLDVESHYFLRHVTSRWLTIEPVLKRIIEQYSVLSEYFLNFLPKQKDSSKVTSTSRYKRIRQYLLDPFTVAYLQFIVTLSSIFLEFLSLFQNEGPLIHILYSKCNELLTILLKKYLKTEVVSQKEGKSLRELDVSNGDNFLPIKQMEIGAGARKTLASLSGKKCNSVYLNFRQCYIKIAEYLQSELPITCQLLKDLQILHPLLRDSPRAPSAFRRLCNTLQLLKLTDAEVDRIIQEWSLYQTEDKISEEWYIASQEHVNSIRNVIYKRIDLYWSKIFHIIDTDSGKPKYSNLSRVVKTCLLLFHGNADAERGFSLNNSVLRNDRSNLNERSIISIRTVKDAVRRNGNLVSNVPITSAMLKKIKEARKEYHADLERHRKEEQIKLQQKQSKQKEDSEVKILLKRQHDVEEELKAIKSKCQKLQVDVQVGQTLLDEGSERLNHALKQKKFERSNSCQYRY